ncbi:glycosyltransferase [Ornithinimicrobium flavum]|uniref:glycosyltransferase n=1 Tax=Ornithinimicrobium flavum TaxID=1288636 RepID=UPI003083F1D3
MAKEAELLGLADAGVTLAGTMRADLLARGGVDPDRLLVVPNAVDAEALTPAPRDEALAGRWGTRGVFTFGYVTNLDHAREQVEDLVRAAVLLRNEGLPVRALVVGDGRRRAQVEELVTRWRAEDCVVLPGTVPHAEVAAAYGLLDVLVVPRSHERAARLVTPLKPYEAMALGVPVVVSAQPALLEVIGDGERGWSYPAGDAAALAALLRRLAEDPQERAAVAARARDWVLRERTWAGNARRYAELYRSVLAGRGRPTG